MSDRLIDDQARAFVESQRVGRLATAGSDGGPVVFALVGDVVYIAIDEKPKSTLRLRRVRNIEENPRAALLVDVYEDDWSQLRWLLLRGAASVLGAEEEHASERAEALAALRARYPQYASMALEQRPLIRLAVERATGWRGS